MIPCGMRAPVAVWRPCELLYTGYLLTYSPDRTKSADFWWKLARTRVNDQVHWVRAGLRQSPRTLSGRVRSGAFNGIQLLISKAQSVIIHGRPQRVNRHLPRKFSRNNNEIKSQHAQKFLEDQDCSSGDIHAVHE